MTDDTRSNLSGAVKQPSVFIYINVYKEVGDKDHIKVFENEAAANAWFREHDPEGVAFEYEVEGS